MGFFSKGLKNKFETAVVNEPSAFEPLKFNCVYGPLKTNMMVPQTPQNRTQGKFWCGLVWGGVEQNKDGMDDIIYIPLVMYSLL